jgi:hypothetical protein
MIARFDIVAFVIAVIVAVVLIALYPSYREVRSAFR